MGAGRIDHAAEALSLLARAQKQGSDALGDTLRLDAFVHATLAVAEQQRVANLIAAHATAFDGQQTWPEIAGYPSDVRALIEAGLGL